MATRHLDPGETLIAQGDLAVSLYELRAGTMEVLRDGVTVAVVAEPGTFFGELSLLLDRPASASVRARTDAVVEEVDDARGRLANDAEFAGALARLLATRVDTMSGYLADLRNQYADHGAGLEMIDEVLASLSYARISDIDPGSERELDAPY